MATKAFSIKLFNVTLSCDRENLPDSVWLEIMLKVTPLELLVLQKLSRKFRRILTDNSRCWAQARNNMNPPVPPPPQVDAAGVWSESAYTQLIFGGGECIVKSCKRWTTRFPCSYALRMRVCSPKCEAILHRHYNKDERKINNGYLTSCAIPGKRGLRQMGQTQRLHFRSWLPYDERDMTKYPMHRVSSIATADQEWFSARAITEKRSARPPVAVIRTVAELQQQYRLRTEALPRIMQNAKALQQWTAAFSEAQKSVDLMNVAFFKEFVSPREQIPYRKLLKTRSVSNAMESFGRSLSTFDMRDWCGIRANAVREYRALRWTISD
ncbi:Dienelactone hydrolase endo-1,3,1,4-beta-D-glucanase [Mycena venus]|uniref:Dienelactone hydrolase endo-1,3,1,4-beta-D-glucanase n=1 Tax=Mycena venus TaxID=2733690 RepID=A0A8H6X3F1_9AGAR|nr:Dienelactone hydrolase endo-1,3,1,4-beta-D-glucanase [Mycena venus]